MNKVCAILGPNGANDANIQSTRGGEVGVETRSAVLRKQLWSAQKYEGGRQMAPGVQPSCARWDPPAPRRRAAKNSSTH